MKRHLQLEHLTPAQAAELLAGVVEDLAAGTLKIEGAEARIAGPVRLTVDLDASHTSPRLAIALECHGPDRVSRLLEEELARPGG